MRVCVFEFTNARALPKADSPLPPVLHLPTWTRPGLKQLGQQADSRAARVTQCWWGQGSCPQVQVTPPLVLLEPAGEPGLAGLQPGVGGEEEASASVCVLSDTLTPHDSVCQLIHMKALKERHL